MERWSSIHCIQAPQLTPEGAGGGAERLGQQQAFAVRVVAAGPFDHDLDRQGADAEAVKGLEAGADPGLERFAGRVSLERSGEGFAEGVEFGKMIAAGLDVFANPVGRTVVGSAGFGTVAGAAVGEGAVEAKQGVSGGGLVLGQLDDLVARHREALEDRIGEGLGQFGLGSGAGGLAQGAQVYVIGIGQPQQQLGRDGALVALDMVQIGGRNAEIARHGRLGQGEIAPQPLEAAAEEQLAISGGVHGCS